MDTLNVSANQLTSLSLPPGLTHLTGLFFVGNDLTTLTLPPDLTQSVSIGFLDNPLTTFVLSEVLAATNLVDIVASLQSQGVLIFTYPLDVEFVRPRTLTGAFELAIAGPPGAYQIMGSTDLATWNEVGVATNTLGRVIFIEVSAQSASQKFYRARAMNMKRP